MLHITENRVPEEFVFCYQTLKGIAATWERREHDDVIKWKQFSRYWPFVRGIHRSPHKGQWRGALMFSLICAWINGWVNNGEAGDLIRHRAHYDVTVMDYSNSIFWDNAHLMVRHIKRFHQPGSNLKVNHYNSFSLSGFQCNSLNTVIRFISFLTHSNFRMDWIWLPIVGGHVRHQHLSYAEWIYLD